MKKILVIEDDERIRFIIKDFLTMKGYQVVEAIDGEEGLDKFYEDKYDLIVLDIMLPKINGWEVCKRIKEEFQIPILILTAKTQDEDEVKGLELGADEYLKKPFSLKVFEIRVKKLLNLIGANKDILEFNNLKIDNKAHKVYLNDKAVELTPKEYELLLFLIKNKNIALTREKLLNNVWDIWCESDLRTVDTHIKKLRKKIRIPNIITVRGIGYMFEVNE